jgi:hypothetical protein
MAEWLKVSRLKGVLRYHYQTIGNIATWAIGIVLGVQVISLLIPLLNGGMFQFDGIRANFEIVFFAALVTAIITAGRSSRFLIRFGTARTPVWLGNVLGLFAGMVFLLAATFLLNLAIGGLLFPLTALSPLHFDMTPKLFALELQNGLKDLPGYLLYTLEWSSIFYLYACLLRRFRVLTISLSIGIPLLFVILMFIPAVREGLATLRGNNQGDILMLGLRWVQIVQDVILFVEKHWETLQLIAGVVSLPLSYAVMRGTKQP